MFQLPSSRLVKITALALAAAIVVGGLAFSIVNYRRQLAERASVAGTVPEKNPAITLGDLARQAAGELDNGVQMGGAVVGSKDYFAKLEGGGSEESGFSDSASFFKISGGKSPYFLDAVIDPLDVRPGEIQKMMVKVRGDDPVSSVTAEIWHDLGADTAELKLVSGTPLEGDWYGEWAVHDTHSEKYRTVFTARDGTGSSNVVTLAWSDSCVPPISGDWTIAVGESCSLSSTGGADSGSITIEGENIGGVWAAKDSSRNWYGMAVSSTGQYQTATVVGGYIYTSSDYGQTWTPNTSLGAKGWYNVALSSTGQYQTATVNGGYIYVSSDYGATWAAKTAAGSRTWVGVALSSTGEWQTALAYNGQIYVSQDSGENWYPRDSSRKWRNVALSFSGQYQTATVQESGYIYISSDYGEHWQQSGSIGNWYDAALSSTGQYQSAVVSGGNIYISSDYGQTWSTKDSSRAWISVDMSSDGYYQAAAVYGGNIYVSNGTPGTMTIGPGATLGWNEGKSVTVGGSIAVSASGAQMRNTNLWMIDGDADNYPSSATQYAQDAAPDNGRRRKDMVSVTTTDCCDANANAKPGQANYYPTVTGCGIGGGYDYNCDNSSTPQYTTLCNMAIGTICDTTYCGTGIAKWWASSVPACGASASFWNGSSCVPNTPQPCR